MQTSRYDEIGKIHEKVRRLAAGWFRGSRSLSASDQPPSLLQWRRRISPWFTAYVADYTIHFRPPLEEETAAIPRQLFLFPTGQGANFGRVLPGTVTLTETTRVETNMLQHPWNTLLVDGVQPPDTKLFEGRRIMTDVLVEAGTHTLSYEFRPSRRYRPTLIVRDLCAVSLLILLFL